MGKSCRPGSPPYRQVFCLAAMGGAKDGSDFRARKTAPMNRKSLHSVAQETEHASTIEAIFGEPAQRLPPCRLLRHPYDMSATLPTNEEAIAYESARECITHVIAIVSSELFGPEMNALSPGRVDALKAKIADLADERQRLRLSDTEGVARVREQYGRFAKQFSRAPSYPVDLSAIP